MKLPNMKVVDCASNIYLGLNSPDSISIASVSFWMRSKIGALNSLLFEDFSINSAYEIVNSDGSEISENAMAILEKMFEIYFLDCRIRNSIGVGAYDVAQQIDSEGGSVRMVNRNEIAKTLLMMKKQEQDNLNQLIGSYKINSTSVLAVHGDDTIPANASSRLTTTRMWPGII